jgi:hypothetical protein
MLDQLFGALLFVFGFQSGVVRGDSTPSSTLTASAAGQLRENEANDKKFIENREKAEKNWAQKRNTFTAGLTKIKDEKKKPLITTLQDRLKEINIKQCTLYREKVKQLTLGLEEIQDASIAYSKETGKEVPSMTATVTAAKKAITDANTLVTAQVEKIYLIDITTEASVKVNFETQRKALAADLKKVRDAVQAARKKVGEAHVLLKKSTGKTQKILIPITTTPTSQTTPTGVPEL